MKIMHMKGLIVCVVKAFVIPIIFFFLLSILLAFDWKVCERSDIVIDNWVSIANLVQFSVFYFHLFYLIIKLTHFDFNEKEYLTYFSMLTINFICGTANLLNYLSGIWGMCSDIYR